jgi:predicted house-cleaning NTP pyrophosphatase (Maf/HAM1 superfamily)
MCFVEAIAGSYANVVGLPMAALVEAMRQKFALEI